MALTPLITAEQLRLALSASTYLAIFDDDNLGDIASVDDSPQVALVLKRAHTRVISRLGTMYQKVVDGTDADKDSLLIDAELNYAQGLAFDRHPEYTRTYGHDKRRTDCYSQADATMEMLQEMVLRLVEAPPEPEPRADFAVSSAPPRGRFF